MVPKRPWIGATLHYHFGKNVTGGDVGQLKELVIALMMFLIWVLQRGAADLGKKAIKTVLIKKKVLHDFAYEKALAIQSTLLLRKSLSCRIRDRSDATARGRVRTPRQQPF